MNSIMPLSIKIIILKGGGGIKISRVVRDVTIIYLVRATISETTIDKVKLGDYY